MARRRLLLVALLAASAGAACSLFACGDSTFEGTQGDGGSADSSRDADTDTDSETDAVAPGARFCTTRSPTPFFCADFDDDNIHNAFIGKTDTTFFGTPDPTDGGIVALEPTGENDSGALHAFLPTLPDALPAAETLAGTFPTLHASRLTFRVDLRFNAADDVSSVSHVYLLEFGLDGTSQKTQYALVGYSGHMHLEIAQDSVSQVEIDLGPPPAQAAGWVPFTIDVQLTAGTGKVTATLGSISGNSGAFATNLQQDGAIVFGLQTMGQTATFDVSFDNATLDVVGEDGGIAFVPDAG